MISSFVRSFVRWFVRWFVRSFVCSFVRPLFVCSFVVVCVLLRVLRFGSLEFPLGYLDMRQAEVILKKPNLHLLCSIRVASLRLACARRQPGVL